MMKDTIWPTVLLCSAALCACSAPGIEPRRAYGAAQAGLGLPDSTLRVELWLTDEGGAPFSGAVIARAERHSGAIPHQRLIPSWQEVYTATTTLEDGRGVLEFGLAELDAAVLAEFGGFDLLVASEVAVGPYPWESGVHVDPAASLAAFFEGLGVVRGRSDGSGLIARVDASLAPPPRYGTLRFSEPLEGGEHLLSGEVGPTGEPNFMTRMRSRVEGDLLELPAGAVTVDVYSWSRAHACAIKVYDGEWELLEPAALLRARGTLEVER